MQRLIVYEKPTCNTCRRTVKILTEMGFSFDKIDYRIDLFSKKKLQSLLDKMNKKPSDIIRTKENSYKEFVKGKDLNDDELIDLMIIKPELIQRPIIEFGDKAILARPIELLYDFFKY